jgi:hypothetical protein
VPDYRQVSRPAALKASPLTDEELKAIMFASPEGSIGLATGEGGPRQLEFWWKDGKTYVRPADGPEGLLPWKFSGDIHPFTARDHFDAVIAPKLTNED